MNSTPQIYTPEYYQKLSALEQQQYWWTSGMQAIAAAILDRYFQSCREAMILDAGCGTGAFMQWLKRYQPKRLLGMDISQHALKICQQSQFINICQASVIALPFCDATFDLITCNDVLHHIAGQDQQVLREFYRLIKPGGLLYLRTNAKHWFRPNDDQQRNFHRFSHSEILMKANNAGFKILISSNANSLPSLIAEVKNIISGWQADNGRIEAYRGLNMVMPAQLINSFLYRWLKCEGYLIEHHWQLPFGHSIILLLQKPLPDLKIK